MKRVFTHIGFSMALALVVLNIVSIDTTVIIAAGLAVAFIASLLTAKTRQSISVPLCLGTALFACLVFMVNYSCFVFPQLEMQGKEANASFYYIDIPQQSDSGYSYVVKSDNMKLRVVTDEEIEAQPYQLINADLKYYKTADSAFDSYGNWGNGIYISAKAENIKVSNEHIFSPLKWVYNLRCDIINTLSEKIGGDAGGIASALVTGFKGNISDDIGYDFRYAGVSHIIAVSGFHLTVATAGLFYLLKLLGADDRIKAISGIAFIFVCIGLAGFSKSVIRAGIMLSVLLIGQAMKKRADSLNSLGIAVFVICLNPFAVADVGAELSVLSALSLILLRKCRLPRLVEKLLVPFAVLIFTLPVMCVFFGYVSIAGLASNIIVVPIGCFAIIISVLTYISVKISFLPSLFVWLARGIINALISVVHILSSLKFAVVSLPDEVTILVAGVFIFLAVVFMIGNANLFKPLSAICSAVLFVGIIAGAYISSGCADMLVTSNGVVAFMYKSNAYVYNVNTKNDYYNVNAFLRANNRKINALIIGDDSPDSFNYAKMFCDRFGCETIISPSFNAELFEIDGLDTMIIENEYSYQDKNIKFSVDDGCFIEVNGVVVSVGSDYTGNENIIVSDGKIHDDYGTIILDKGDIVYKIYSDSTYNAEVF